jgi:uncharacterized protein (TIGR03083 family)
MNEVDPESRVLYAAMRDEFIEFVWALSEVEQETIVPNCPAWTVRDVVAHVTGVNGDVVDGNTEALGADEWTRHQVESRAELSLAEICDEWESMAPRTSAFMSDDPFWGVRIGADLVTHIHDVLEALGRSHDELTVSGRDGVGIRSALSRYGPFFCERASNAFLAVVSVTVVPDAVGGQAWQSGDGEAAAELSGSAFELLRAFTGRRSLEHVLAMDWSGDPEPYLALINPYGALKSDR